MKPQDHREQCTVTYDMRYEVEAGSCKGTHAGSGILSKGRVVWVQKRLEESTTEASVSAYAEGIGIISLDPRSLAHTD